jgi:ABC-2 type transport system ATP-binding protein
MPAIQAIDLRKEFRRRERVGRRLDTTKSVALAPTTFRVERGECVAILGQNGSGKSTLVRLLSTLLLPDGGTARIFDQDIRTTRGPSGGWSTASRWRRRSSRSSRRSRT